MAGVEHEVPDAPGCPLLGLAADRRSHFTYPHSGHRCFAKKHPATTDARRQSAYCLSLEFSGCDRYLTWRRHAEPGRQPAAQRPDEAAPAREASAATAPAPGTTVALAFRVHVFHVGDSLAGIAAANGLTADQIATANGLTVNDGIADGTPLLIPLGPPASSYGTDPQPTAGR